MDWDEEQRKRLFEDYDVGKISKETFDEKVAILDKLANNAKKHETNGSPKRLMIILSVILILSVVSISAYFIFRNTPEKEAQRLLATMEAVKTEIGKRVQSSYSAMLSAAKTQISEIEKALDLYRLHNGNYPSTEQGLQALVTKPTTSPLPRKYADGGYLRKVSLDPWGNPFIYRSPSKKGEFDIVSFGADGKEGGDGIGKDISNHD